MKIPNKILLGDLCFTVIFILSESQGRVLLCTVQAQLRNAIDWLMMQHLNTDTKHRRLTWSFWYRETARRFPASLLQTPGKAQFKVDINFLGVQAASLCTWDPSVICLSLSFMVNVFFGSAWNHYFLCTWSTFLTMNCAEQHIAVKLLLSLVCVSDHKTACSCVSAMTCLRSSENLVRLWSGILCSNEASVLCVVLSTAGQLIASMHCIDESRQVS